MSTRRGLFHLVDSEPIDGDAVNVNRICSLCGVLVETVSWTNAAWNDRKYHR